MNRIYRLIWSPSARQWIPVSELSRGAARAVVAATLLTVAGFAVAAPSGGQVTAGNGTITQAGNTTTIAQSSTDLSLNWQSFNIGSSEIVNFVQPNSAAIAINRILSNSGTSIFGHLNANGQVWLINPNGILFGKGAQVNVGGLTASTLDFDNSTLDSSGRKFSGPSTGSVVNQGTLNAASGGYVALLGTLVSNQGVIGARLGTVALAAGSAATLTFDGKQLIHLRVDQSTLNDLAENRQLIQADGGQVIMTAGAHDALLASVVNNTGIIEARAVENHDGSIVLTAGMQSGSVHVGGTLDAGAPAGGPGGFIETSAAKVNIGEHANITAGVGGTWLVDPTDLTIDASAAATISNTLTAGTNVTETTTATAASGVGNQSAGAGDINVNAPITWTSSAATLTLSAYNAINVNAPVSGAGAVVMQAANSNLTIASGAFIEGDAGVTLGTAGSFVNQAGASAVSAGASGRWMIYSQDPTLDSVGGLTPNFIQYGAAFQAAPAQSSGNGFLYGITPTLTVTALNGPIQKTYDASTVATLSGANVTASGLVNGDAVASMTGSYQSADAGTNIAVTTAATVADVAVVSASGSLPVYGYALGGAPVTAAVGTITPAPLSAAIIGNPTKVYDGTATATLSSANYGITGFVNGQSATVNQPSSVSFGSADAGAQTVSATFADTNFVAANGTKLSNYTLPTAASGAGAVLQAPLVIAGVLATDKIYDGSTADTLNTGQASIYGVIGSDAVALSSSGAVGSFASANAGNNIAVATSGFTLTGAAQANYQLVQPSGLAAKITPATLTVTGVQATNKVYDGTAADALNLTNAALAGVIAGDASTVIFSSSGATGAFVTKNVGNALGVTTSGFSVSGSSANNYSLSQPVGLAADITPAALTITLTGNPTKPYNGTTTADVTAANFTLTGFVSGEGASIPQTSSTQYASSNAGSQAVTATLALADFAPTGSTQLSNYMVPSSVVGTGTITPAPLTGAIVGNPTKVYDSTTSATLTSTSYTLSGFLPGQSATINQTVGTYSSPNAGVQVVSASVSNADYAAGSGTLLSNYSLPTSLSGTGTITQAQLAGYVQAGIVGNPSKQYDGTTTATLDPANFVLTGFTGGQGASVTQTVGQYASPNAGLQTVIANLSSGDFSPNSGTDLSNYHLPTVAYGAGTITQAPLSVTIVNDPTRVYNATTSMTLTASNYSIAGFVSGEGAQINPSALINYASANVGAENLTAALTPSAYTANSGTLMSNYVMATSASGMGSITPAPVYVTGIYATNKVYDTTTADPLNTGAVALSGVVSSDAGNISLAGTPSGAFGTIHVGTALPVSVSGYSISGSAAPNYILQPTSGLAANITPAPLTITGVSANSKPYDSTTTATLDIAGGGLSGVLGLDGVTLSTAGAQASFSSANAGTGLKVSASGFIIAGPEANDYMVSQPTGLTANITPAPIMAVIIGNPTKVYDGSPSTTLVANNYSLVGFASGQGASVPQSASASYVAADAGTNVAIGSTLVLSDFIANSGTNLSNYQLPGTGAGTGTITQAALTARLVGNPTKSYDATTAATLTSSNYSLSGFVGSQSATITQTVGSYAAASAGSESVTATLAGSDYTAGSATNLNNYSLPASVTGTGTITRAPLSVTGVATTPQVYNGTTQDALSGATLTGTVFGTDAPTLTNVGIGTLGSSGNAGTDSVSTNIGVTGAGSANYIVTQPANLTAVISPAPLSAASSVTKTYDGTTVASLSGGNTTLSGFTAGQSATVNSGVTGTFATRNAGSGITVTGAALSSADLTAGSGTLLSNYSLPVSDNGTGSINPATLTYMATATGRQYGTTPTGLTGSVSGFVNGETEATATLGFETYSTPATAASNVGQYAINGAGLTADNGNYVFTQAAANATALAITPAPLTVANVATTSRAYNGSNVDALTGATLTGTYYNGDAPVLTNYSSGTLSNGGNAGSDSVTTAMGLSGAGSGNYALTQPAGLTALISVVQLTATSSVNRAYTGTTDADLSGANTVLSGFIAGQGATVKTGVTGAFADANVGTGITITGGALVASNLTPTGGTVLSNYTLPSSDNGSGSITPTIIALSGARVYDGATDVAASIFGTSGTIAGVNGEHLTLSGSTVLANKNVGTQTLASQGTLALTDGTGLASNYTLMGGADTVSVTKLGIAVTATAADRNYNGNTTATGVVLASGGVLSGDSLSFTDTSALFTTKNVGTGITVNVAGIAPSGTDAGNYSVNAATSTTANITAAIVNLIGARTYDANTDANYAIFGAAGTLSTGLGTETLVLSGSGTLTSKIAGSETLSSLGNLALGNGSGGGTASNYTLSGGTDTANIAKLAISATGTAANKVYDRTTAATVLTLGSSGVLAGDTVTFADTGATFSDINAANGKIVTIAGISDGGADASNYTLSNSSTTTTANITKLGITVTGTAGNKTYNGNTTATGVVLAGSGVLSGDSLTYHDTSATFDTQNVGVGKTVTIAGITATGTGSSNYSLNLSTTTTANITPAIVNLIGARTYDANTDANYTIFGAAGTLSTGIGSQTLLLSGSGTLTSKNAGAETLSSMGNLSLSDGGGGGLASNYTLSGGTDTANIAKLAITATGTAANKVYDRTTAATVLTVGSSGVLSGDTVTFADTGATFSNNSAATGKTVTIAGITDGGADAGNYTLSNSSTTTTANITPLGITVTGTAGNKTYDGTTTATGVVLASSGVLSGDSLTYSDASANFNTQNAGVGKTVTIAGISATGTGAGNYSLNSSTTTTANITPAIVNLTGTKVYDASTDAAAPVFGSAGTIATGIGTETLVLAGSGSLAAKNAGTEVVSDLGSLSLGNGSGLAGNYTLIGGVDSVTVSKLAISVSGAAADKVYDGTVSAVSSLSSSGVFAGDAVTFADTAATFNNKNAGTGKTVTIVGITDSGADVGNYTLNNTTASTTASITPLGISVTGTAANKVYDGSTAATVTSLLASGLIAGDSVTFADASAAFNDKNVGNGKAVSIVGIVASGADAGNYTLASSSVFAHADVTQLAITVAATGVNKVYDGTVNDTVSLTSSGLVAGDSVLFSDSAATFANKNVGTGKAVAIAGITASGADAGNYILSNSTALSVADITPLTIGIAATAADKVYDGSVAATVTGLTGVGVVAGDSVSFTDSSAAFNDKNAGPAKTVTIAGLSAAGTDSGNYSLANSTTSTTAAITPLAITVTASGTNRIYDGTVVDAATLASSGVLSGDTVVFSDTAALFGNKNAGVDKTVSVAGITAGGADGANYTVNTAASTTADITPLTIAVTGVGANKVYDGTVIDAATLTSAGVIAGDNVVFADTLAVFNNKNVGAGKSVSIVGISSSGADAANYSLGNTTATAIADITPRALTVNAVGSNKVYDGNVLDPVTLSATNALAGDALFFSDTAATFTGKNVGTNLPVAVVGITVTGADAANYTFNSSTTTTASISSRPITVSASGISKTYDGTTADTVSLLSEGVLAGDSVTFSDTSAGFLDKNVGSGKAVNVFGITAGGTDGGNYSVNTSAAAIADITPATLTETASPITASIGQKPVFSGSLTGLVAGDIAATATSGTLIWNASVPVHPVPGSYAVDGSGLTAENYLIVQNPGNAEALTLLPAVVAQQDPTQRIYGLIGLPLAPDYIATPYGVGSNDERSNNTGNARRDWNLADGNKRLSDFKVRTGLSVLGAGVKLPDEGT